MLLHLVSDSIALHFPSIKWTFISKTMFDRISMSYISHLSMWASDLKQNETQLAQVITFSLHWSKGFIIQSETSISWLLKAFTRNKFHQMKEDGKLRQEMILEVVIHFLLSHFCFWKDVICTAFHVLVRFAMNNLTFVLNKNLYVFQW